MKNQEEPNMLTKDDIQKIQAALKGDFAAIRTDIKEARADISNLETKIEEVSETVNAHTLKLDNLASKHDLETMLEKSLSLTVLKVEFEIMKKHMREKLHVEI